METTVFTVRTMNPGIGQTFFLVRAEKGSLVITTQLELGDIIVSYNFAIRKNCMHELYKYQEV